MSSSQLSSSQLSSILTAEVSERGTNVSNHRHPFLYKYLNPSQNNTQTYPSNLLSPIVFQITTPQYFGRQHEIPDSQKPHVGPADLSEAPALTIPCGCTHIEPPHGSRWREITPSINALSPEAPVFFSKGPRGSAPRAVPCFAFGEASSDRVLVALGLGSWEGDDRFYPYSIIR